MAIAPSFSLRLWFIDTIDLLRAAQADASFVKASPRWGCVLATIRALESTGAQMRLGLQGRLGISVWSDPTSVLRKYIGSAPGARPSEQTARVFRSSQDAQ